MKTRSLVLFLLLLIVTGAVLAAPQDDLSIQSLCNGRWTIANQGSVSYAVQVVLWSQDGRRPLEYGGGLIGPGNTLTIQMSYHGPSILRVTTKGVEISAASVACPSPATPPGHTLKSYPETIEQVVSPSPEILAPTPTPTPDPFLTYDLGAAMRAWHSH